MGGDGEGGGIPDDTPCAVSASMLSPQFVYVDNAVYLEGWRVYVATRRWPVWFRVSPSTRPLCGAFLLKPCTHLKVSLTVALPLQLEVLSRFVDATAVYLDNTLSTNTRLVYLP